MRGTRLILAVLITGAAFAILGTIRASKMYKDYTQYHMYDSTKVLPQGVSMRVEPITITEKGLIFEIREVMFQKIVFDYIGKKTLAVGICPYCLPAIKTVTLTVKSPQNKYCNLYCPGCMAKFYAQPFPDKKFYCRSRNPIQP